MEWKDKYNSFNSDIKGATYYDNYVAINEWRLGLRTAPLPPIEISFDPIAQCNLNCHHCNFAKYFDIDIGNRRMENKHIDNLLYFFADWIKNPFCCFGGGGEPTLHTHLADALLLANRLGIQNSIATNGINFNDELIEIASLTCRWIGISVDAATKETYNIGRRGDYFNITIKNIEKLTKKVRDLHILNDIAYKFLIFDYNQHEIYEACKLAKELGVKDFHVRPADFKHQGMKDIQRNPYNIELIKEQFEKCHQIEDENFRVFTVVHKFNPDFTPKRNFTECYASPLCLQINPNGYTYLCPDCRNLDFYKLGEHYPNPENILNFWGSSHHYNLVFNSGCKNCFSRCTFSPYNEMCERLIIRNDDSICRGFV